MDKLKKLKTFNDACKIEGLDPKKVIPDFSGFPKQDHAAMIAHAKLVIIARAANRLANDGIEWKPDWSNHEQWKYNVWMYHPAGRGSSGFRFGDCGRWGSAPYVGSRLCYISHEVATYVGKKFETLYKEYFTL